ncbi:MAG: KEOPS complex kinase/ATPase Bud32 [Candidatus Nanoarchaeia archaeon]
MKIISKGAEAVIYSNGTVIKKRIKKGYRHPEIDFELRKTRTTREANMLKKIDIPAPKLISVDKKEMTIEMDKLTGKKLSTCLEKMDYKNISKEIGEKVAKLHKKNIIHGDLTTSNMIFSDKLYFIDFGLAFTSTKDEDKAVDLHLLKQALSSRHSTISDECFEEIKKNYANETVLKRLKEVEKRGRHKQKAK